MTFWVLAFIAEMLEVKGTLYFFDTFMEKRDGRYRNRYRFFVYCGALYLATVTGVWIGMLKCIPIILVMSFLKKVLKNTGKAVIHLKLECEDHKLIFAIRNPVTEKVEIENDTIKSKRGDHHGIGLLNVKAVVDKYGGDMVLSCDENEFKAVVIL